MQVQHWLVVSVQDHLKHLILPDDAASVRVLLPTTSIRVHGHVLIISKWLNVFELSQTILVLLLIGQVGDVKNKSAVLDKLFDEVIDQLHRLVQKIKVSFSASSW